MAHLKTDHRAGGKYLVQLRSFIMFYNCSNSTLLCILGSSEAVVIAGVFAAVGLVSMLVLVWRSYESAL